MRYTQQNSSNSIIVLGAARGPGGSDAQRVVVEF